MIVKPVIEHTTIVSIKVWFMDTSPWATGWWARAAAAAMAPEPSPLSLLKTPRAMPNRMPCVTVAPVNPPTAAVGENASLNLNMWKAMSGSVRQLSASTISPPTR